MTKKLLLLWLLLPVPLLALHFSLGQRWLIRDQAISLSRQAEHMATNGATTNATALYDQALALLDAEKEPRLRADLVVASARTRLQAGDAAEALSALDDLLLADTFSELTPQQQTEARELCARSHYYAAWVMRLEGATRDEWLPEAETARRNYRYLTETTLESSPESHDHAANLEAVVEFERLTMTELLARPLPKECQSMCNKKLSDKRKKCKKPGQCKKPGSGKRKKKNKNDIRDKKPANGAGIVEYQEGMGS